MSRQVSTREPSVSEEPGSGLTTGRAAIVFVISAPSGSGKSSLVALLMSGENKLRFSISYTTRKPRGLEKNGAEYVFVGREEFISRRDKGEFLEWAEVFGNFYGTHREVLEQAASECKDLLLDIDVQGARKLKAAIPEAVSIFVLPPSRAVLEQRLRSRSQDSEETIERRLRDAETEIRDYQQYDYVLVNNELRESAADLVGIVKAERVKRRRMEVQIGPILESFGTQAD